MPGPLDKTLQRLAETSNSHAADVLVTALDALEGEDCLAAAAAILRRGAARGVMQLIQRVQQMPAGLGELLSARRDRLKVPLKQCLNHGEPDLRRRALDVIRIAALYEQVPDLLQLLQDPANPVADEVAETISDLADRLWQVGQSTGTEKYLRNAPQIRHQMQAALAAACDQFEQLTRPHDVVEAALILGDPNNFAVRKALWQGPVACREFAGQLLMTSLHPGVMALVLDSMEENYPHPTTFEALRFREDPEFVCFTLRWLPRNLTATQQKNFKQIDRVVWIDEYGTRLPMVPPGLQDRLIDFVQCLGIPRAQKDGVREWLLRHGGVEGRQKAAGLMSSLDRSSVREIVAESLNSGDEEIEAWATSQLRSQHLPEAISLLIQRLDSSAELVRVTAQKELQSFNFELLMQIFDHLDPQVCRRAGVLMLKIDPGNLDAVRRELNGPVHHRRIRAAQAVEALGLQREVLPELVPLLQDEEPLVRRTAVEVLGRLSDPAVERLLVPLLEDPSQRVREAAQQVLQDFSRSEMTSLGGVG